MYLHTWFRILLVFAFCFSAYARPTLDKRELTLELEEVEGAINYQIEIRAVDRSKNEKRYTFTSEKPKFKVNLRPGHFEMRLRSADDRGTFGEWSPPSPLSVAPKAVVRVKPVDGAKFSARGKTDVEFEWVEAPSAQGYRVIVVDAAGKPVVEDDFSENRGKLTLPAGFEYRWHVVSRYEEDLFSESEGEPWRFVVTGQGLAPPVVVSQDLLGVKWRAEESADFEFADVNVLGKERVVGKGSSTTSGELKYTLEERTLYRVRLIARKNLMEPSAPKNVFFERQGTELIVYGDKRPADSERLASKGRRWFATVKRASFSFNGQNVQYGQSTHFQGATGVNLKAGVVSQGRTFDKRFVMGYSAFSVTSQTGDVSATLLQGDLTFQWRKNLGFKKLPIKVHFGFGYEETPEFIANSTSVLALQYFRTINWSLGVETSYAFSRRRSVNAGFGIALPLTELQSPGKVESASRAELYLRYYHDFSRLTGILGVEIQGSTFEYGGNKFDFSSGGLCFGLMY